MSKIHHRCRCTGQEFTFDEWCARCREHDSAEIVFEYGGFGWNINDVCMTPNVPITWEQDMYMIEVRTAMSPNGRWDYGMDINFHSFGHMRGVRFLEGEDGYETEKEAIYAALEEIERDLMADVERIENQQEYDDYGNPVSNSSILPRYRRALEFVRKCKETYDPRQLTLFEI